MVECQDYIRTNGWGCLCSRPTENPADVERGLTGLKRGKRSWGHVTWGQITWGQVTWRHVTWGHVTNGRFEAGYTRLSSGGRRA